MDKSEGRKLYRETREKIVLNIIQCHLGLIAYPNPSKLLTSSNTFLLDYLDTSETKGLLSFIPIEFLRDYAKDKLSVTYNNISELEEKRKLLSLVDVEFTENFFNNTYKNVPLKYFRKPILQSALTVTRDSVQVQRTIREKEYIELGFNFEDIAAFPSAFTTNQNEWMYLSQIQDYLTPWELAFPNIKLLTPYQERCPKLSSERFLVGMILQNYHFTCYLIDRKCPGKNTNKCNVYFFNSGGYEPAKIPGVKTWSIESDFRFMRHHNSGNMGQDAINIQEIMKQIHVDNVFFNTFRTQHLNSECGGFTTLFLMLAIFNIIDSTTGNGRGFDFRNILYIYNNIYQMGYDLSISMIKGLMYFTQEDLSSNNLTKMDYLSSGKVYPISNRKRNEFEELVNRAKVIIQDVSSSL